MIVTRGTCIKPIHYMPSKLTNTVVPYMKDGNITVKKAGDQCGPLDICEKSSFCIDGECVCPAGSHKSETSGLCEPNTSVRTASPMKFVKLSEPCNNGEICVDGSICSHSKLCTCPPKLPIVYNGKCISNLHKSLPGQFCNETIECVENSSCIDRICRCVGNFVADNGKCTSSNRITVSSFGVTMQPILAEYTSNYVRSDLGPANCDNESNCGENQICVVNRCKCKPGFIKSEEICVRIQELSMTLNDSVQPRITGPPLRKLRIFDDNKSSDIAHAADDMYFSDGLCPKGSAPLRDSSGYLIKCNGMRPKCPSQTYCYVTSYSSETYNCCTAH